MMSNIDHEVAHLRLSSVHGSPLLWALQQISAGACIFLSFITANDSLSNHIYPSAQNIALSAGFLAFVILLRSFKRDIAISNRKVRVGDSIGRYPTFYQEIELSQDTQLFRRNMGRWVSIEIVTNQNFLVLTRLKKNSIDAIILTEQLKSIRDIGENSLETQ